MNKKIRTISLAISCTLIIGIGILFAISACTKDSSAADKNTFAKKDVNKDLIPSEYQLDKPDNGFLSVSENGKLGTKWILLGTTPDEFIKTTKFINDKFVDENDILYTFEDCMDSIVFVNRGKNGLDMIAMEEKIHLCNFEDINGGIMFDIETPDGSVIKQTIFRDSINVSSVLKDLCEYDVVENPFIVKEHKTKGVGPIVKAALKWGGKLVAAAAIIAVVVDVWEFECQASLDADKHNCERSSKKCLKKSGLCHYECIACPQ